MVAQCYARGVTFFAPSARRILVATALVGVSALPACTLLADFVDADDPCANGMCTDSSFDVAPDRAIDSASDARDSGPPPVDAAGACKGKSNGWYCGNNGLPVAVPKEYLVECHDGGATLTYCPNSCLGFPSGTPDRCDPCAGKANGKYCGQSFWPGTENAPFLFSCGGGTAIIQQNCGVAGCSTGMGNAACK
ncbi:hypothetical protein BH09MYX1_BH09MYX1_47310 [soil metagenome]